MSRCHIIYSGNLRLIFMNYNYSPFFVSVNIWGFCLSTGCSKTTLCSFHRGVVRGHPDNQNNRKMDWVQDSSSPLTGRVILDIHLFLICKMGIMSSSICGFSQELRQFLPVNCSLAQCPAQSTFHEYIQLLP